MHVSAKINSLANAVIQLARYKIKKKKIVYQSFHICNKLFMPAVILNVNKPVVSWDVWPKKAAISFTCGGVPSGSKAGKGFCSGYESVIGVEPLGRAAAIVTMLEQIIKCRR